MSEPTVVEELKGLHKPWGIYDECRHDHTEEELDAGLCLNIEEVGLTCDDGLMYRICAHCCTDGDYQTESCATAHLHGADVPICSTAAILERAGAV